MCKLKGEGESSNWVERGVLYWKEDKITWTCLLIMCVGGGTTVIGTLIGSDYFVSCGAIATIVFSGVFLFHLHRLISSNGEEMEWWQHFSVCSR